MERKLVLKGVLMVGLGATSYGMLATFVKLAYSDVGIAAHPFTPAEITSSQFVIGIFGILLVNAFRKIRHGKTEMAPVKDRFRLMLAGTSTGLTSIFYYLAVKYIPVSIGIVLLMQTVWMGVLLEMALERKLPATNKIISVFLVLIGTVMAANFTGDAATLDWRGVGLGLLAAASFTATMFTANRIAIEISSAQRSLYMLLGGAVMVFFFAIMTQTVPFNYDIFYKWGILLALFGTIIPPILLNAGFPLTGIGLGSIVSSLELPVSVAMAYFLLDENVRASQWIGIVIIISAIVMMNVKLKKRAAADSLS